MSVNIFSIKMDDPISKVKDIFEEKGFHHLMVVENNELLGVISDRDLLKAISPKVNSEAATAKDLATLNKRVHQIMSHDPISLKDDSTVIQAVDLFNQHKISCIPIVNENNEPVGIVSWRDIMKALGKKHEKH